MITALGALLSRLTRRWMPDPFAIAVALTLVTFVLAWGLTESGPAELIGSWGGRLRDGQVLGREAGLWRLLGFGMQMCLILVTGYALAATPAARAGIRWLADRPNTPGAAIATTAAVAMLCGWINWGLGLIVGALLARDMGRSALRRQIPVHYPLLGAAGYTGLMIWHGGLSGTAPFKITQRKDLVELLGGLPIDPIPLDRTLLSPLNLALSAVLLIAVPWLLVRMMPRDPSQVRAAERPPDPEPEPKPAGTPTPAERLEDAPLLGWLIGLLALTYLWLYLSEIGPGRADLNAINLLFLALGMILHGSPKAYGQAVGEAASGCAGIILQFPFYSGIMGLMAASGLMTLFAGWMTSIASDATFAPLTFLSAGLVNLFVPSGGGQWAVQGPVIVKAAHDAGVPLEKAIMAFAYGDGWTNMLQPFWALPLLAITGLKARELIGYTAALMLLVAPIYLIALSI